MAFFKRKAEVIDYWHTLIPSFNTSVQKFYERVEQELQDCRVPDLEVHRIDWNEGGLLSAKREYLRLTRERLIFDICAAPFGTLFFFSCRFAEIPAVINPLAIVSVFVVLFIGVSLFLRVFGFILGFCLFLGTTALCIYVLRNAVAVGLANLDRTLMRTPLFGPLYERLFRKETYYRADTRIMYLDTVPSIVKKVVNDVTGAQGIKLTERVQGDASQNMLRESSSITPRQHDLLTESEKLKFSN
jgi:hypothetical protein